MRSIIAFLTTLALSACTVSCHRDAKPARFPVAAADLAASTRRLEASVIGATVGFATAWLVDQGPSMSYWVTAGHACHAGYDYALIAKEGSDPGMRALVWAVDESVDLCMLVSGPVAGLPLKLADADPAYAAPVRYVGSPLGYFGDGIAPYWEGHFVGRTEGKAQVVAAIPAYPGASGSAVVDEAGRVVGVLVAVARDWPEISLVVPYEVVRRFLGDNGLAI